MVAVDLSFARETVKGLMTDTCRITVDAGPADDTFNYATGETTRSTPTVIYEGICLTASRARPTGTRAGFIDYEGATPAVIQIPEVRIPFDGPEVPLGANVEILTATDPTVAGYLLVVRDVGYGTFKVWRVLACNHWVKAQLLEHK